MAAASRVVESVPVWKITYHAHHFASVLSGAAIGARATKDQMTMTKKTTKDWSETTQWLYIGCLFYTYHMLCLQLCFFSSLWLSFLIDIGWGGIYWFSEPTFKTFLKEDEITFLTVYDMTLFANFHIQLIKGRAAPQTPLFAQGGPKYWFSDQLLYLFWKRMKLSFLRYMTWPYLLTFIFDW